MPSASPTTNGLEQVWDQINDQKSVLTEHRIECEKRFTALETRESMKIAAWGFIGGVVSGVVVALMAPWLAGLLFGVKA